MCDCCHMKRSCEREKTMKNFICNEEDLMGGEAANGCKPLTLRAADMQCTKFSPLHHLENQKVQSEMQLNRNRTLAATDK